MGRAQVADCGSRSLLPHIILFATGVSIACAQCFGGTETYEKTTGVKFTYGASQGILTQPGTGITRDCTAICRQTPTCAAFTVVSNLSSKCGDRLWAFERVVGAYLEGFDNKEERNIQTKTECEKLCLFETTFICRSAEFDESLNVCRLSREDRRSQPSAFRKVPGSSVDYLENQCVRPWPDCRYNVREGSAVISMDELQFAANQAECEALCDQARGFTCRSFTYAKNEKRCYLSGDDSLSLNNAPLLIKRDAVYAEKQCSISQCEDGLFTFEKVTGHFLRSAQQVGLAMAASPGITLQCGAKCLEAGSDCPAFSLDYNAMKCFKLDRNTQGRGSDLSPREGQSYFEKICLRGYIHGCEGRAWAFERRQGKELQGHDDLKLNLVQSRRDCMEACLSEQRFTCRSAEYDTLTTECRLSSEDRRTRPSDYVDAPPTTEYLENQCLPQEARCTFKSIPNSYPRYLDLVLSLVSDEMDCKRRCYEYTDFICRSFSYYPSGSQCFISGDDRASAGNEALMSRPGTDYFERVCQTGGGTSPGNPPGTLFGRTDSTPSLCGIGGRLEFEKVTGFELQGQRGYTLFRNSIPGITTQCAQLCRSDPRCRGFNLDYNRNDCTALEGELDGARIDVRPVPGIAYFEGVCLQGATCNVPWVYERFISRELRGFVNAAYPGISKIECQERCLEERSFVCRSITYNYLRKECRLSCEDRYTQPQAFIVNGDTDYLENHCAPRLTHCAYTYHKAGQQLIYTDKSLSSFSDKSCEQACDVEREFVCRSYTFLGQTGVNNNHCLLSGSLGSTIDIGAFQPQSGAIYAEKECLPSSAVAPPPPPLPPPVPPAPPNIPGRFPSGSEPGPSLLPFPCRNTLTYEKIAGATFTNSRREPIRTRDDIGIAVECLVKCAQMRQHCLAVSVENIRGGRQRCYALDRSSDSESGPLESAPDLAYFQKICLQEAACAKAWAFTRVPSYELAAPNSVEVRNIFSRRQCQDECLRETRIICRSATYYGRERLCKLTPETRRTTPQHFRRVSPDVDYMENECAPKPPSCDYTDYPGRFLPYTDRYIPQIYDAPECKHLCNQEQDFNCRSFNYHVVRRDCFLSSDDTFAADRSSLLMDRDFYYSEHGTCSNVRVDCTQADMLITFLFGGPFEGRVYATGNPQACFEMGSGQSQLVLRIPMGTQCGTVQQGRGRYVNHVVIQQNPVIMQETDKTVRVECSFDASDQTVSYAPSGGRNPEGNGISVTVPFRPSGTNIVTNTAPTPNVRMRIITHKGQEASVVGLGEELQLKIEIDPTSAFGVFVRNLEARTDNGELLTLIDNVGCPRDPNIFPALQAERGTRDLFADFKAFRFPSTATVNFVATVQFCQDVCEPIRCNNGVPSFGRRRKRDVTQSIDPPGKNSTIKGKCKYQEEERKNMNTSLNENDDNSSTDPNYCDETATETTLHEDLVLDTTVPVPISDYDAEVSEEHPATPAVGDVTNTTNQKESGPELPSALPLQLRLVVGEDIIPKPTKPPIFKKESSRGATVQNTINDGTADEYLNTGAKDESTNADSVCATKLTVASSIIAIILFNISFVFCIMYFYRVQNEQRVRHESLEQRLATSQIPEVLFRNVYDRLPPNPTFSKLGNEICSEK